MKEKEKRILFAKAPEPKPWKPWQRFLQIFLSIAAIVIIIGIFHHNTNQPISWQQVLPPVANPPVLENFSVNSQSGKSLLPYEKSKLTLVYFFKDDCCKADLRRLLAMHQHINSNDLSLAIISTSQDIRQARKYLSGIKQNNVSLFFDPAVEKMLSPPTYPTIWLMNNHGKLLAIKQQKTNWHHANVQKAVEEVLNDQNF